jgi:hypothetical protein
MFLNMLNTYSVVVGLFSLMEGEVEVVETLHSTMSSQQAYTNIYHQIS